MLGVRVREREYFADEPPSLEMQRAARIELGPTWQPLKRLRGHSRD